VFGNVKYSSSRVVFHCKGNKMIVVSNSEKETLLNYKIQPSAEGFFDASSSVQLLAAKS